MPTKDEALKKAQAGNAPGVNMKGAADQTAGEQGQAVDAKGQEAVTTGRDDAGRPMGENQVYPNAPKEELKGKVPGREGGKGGVRTSKASTGAVPAEAASTVAEHDRKPQFQAAFGKGQKEMSEAHQTKDKNFRESQAKHKQQVAGEVAGEHLGAGGRAREGAVRGHVAARRLAEVTGRGAQEARHEEDREARERPQGRRGQGKEDRRRHEEGEGGQRQEDQGQGRQGGDGLQAEDRHRGQGLGQLAHEGLRLDQREGHRDQERDRPDHPGGA